MFTKNSIVGIIGAGAMGSGIAQVASMAGHKVIVFDSNSTALQHAKAALKATLAKLVEKEKITAPKSDEINNNIIWSDDQSSFADCAIIIEAIVENLDVKQKVFSTIEKIVSKDCVLASNTSSLSITSIASACQISKRVIGIHFFNPAPLMPLVEIIPALTSEPTIVAESKKLVDSWNKVTVLVKDTPGFIVNRVARSFYGEAIRLYEEGYADIPTIDWALKEFGGFKMGPFELMDLIGNDINYTVTETVWQQMFYDPRYKPSLTQKRMVEAKRFGRKSGQGYYMYTSGVVVPEPNKNEQLGKTIVMRVLGMLINEAADTLYLNIASRDDIDLAMTKGVNYPKGLLKWADEIGIEMVLQTLQGLYDEYAEDRYRPSVLLKRMAKAKQKFY